MADVGRVRVALLVRQPLAMVPQIRETELAHERFGMYNETMNDISINASVTAIRDSVIRSSPGNLLFGRVGVTSSDVFRLH